MDVTITSLRYLGHTNKVSFSQKMTHININKAVDYLNKKPKQNENKNS